MSGLNDIAKTAVNSLEKKTFGGVSRESAEKAIKTLEDAGERAINELKANVNGKSQIIESQSIQIKNLNQQLATSNAANAYQAQQIAEGKEALGAVQNKLDATTAKLNKANKTKSFVKENADGSKTIRKANKNGTTMKTEISPDGQTKSVEVEQLDGTVRKTMYDGHTHTRKATTTNTNGDTTYNYNLAGKTESVIKDGEQTAVKLVNKSETVNQAGQKVIVEEFSNGETVQTFIPKSNKDAGGMQKIRDGKIVEQVVEEGNGKTHIVYGKNSTTATYTAEWKAGDTPIKSVRKSVVKKDINGNEYLASASYDDGYGKIVTMETKLNNYGLPKKRVGHITYSQENKEYKLKEADFEYNIVDKGEQYMPAFRYENKLKSAKVIDNNGNTAEYASNYRGDIYKVEGSIKDDDNDHAFTNNMVSKVLQGGKYGDTVSDFMSGIPRNY